MHKRSGVSLQFCDPTLEDRPAFTAERIARGRAATGTAAALPPQNDQERQRSLRRSNDFVHKFNPSGYDEETALTLDQRPEITGLGPAQLIRSQHDTPATLYGRWWHSFLQEISWREDLKKADAVFRREEEGRLCKHVQGFLEETLRDVLQLEQPDVRHHQTTEEGPRHRSVA